jgi:hypothetical protein
MRTNPGGKSHPPNRRQTLAGYLGLEAGMARRIGRPVQDRRSPARSQYPPTTRAASCHGFPVQFRHGDTAQVMEVTSILSRPASSAAV